MEEARSRLLDPEVLRQLVRRLEAAGVDQLEVVHGASRLYIRREPGSEAIVSLRQPAGSRSAVPEGQAVAAPLTGVAYLRPSPAEPPFVETGAMVEVGQVVALIETMKLFNEVTAEFAGEVLSIAVQEGALVEAGQPLLYLRPREGSEEG